MIKRFTIMILFIIFIFILTSCNDEADEFIETYMDEILYKVFNNESFQYDIEKVEIKQIKYTHLIIEVSGNETRTNSDFYLFLLTLSIDNQIKYAYIEAREVNDSQGTSIDIIYKSNNQEDYYNDVLFYSNKEGLETDGIEILRHEINEYDMSSDKIQEYFEIVKEIYNDVEVAINHIIVLRSIDDVELSLDNITFTHDISDNAFKEYMNDYISSWSFNFITSMNGKIFNEFNNINNQDVSEGYVSFDVFFRSETKKIIKMSSMVINTIPKLYTSSINFIDSKGVSKESGSALIMNITDAMRISFVGMIDGSEKIVNYEFPESSTNTISGELIQDDLSNAKGMIDYYQHMTGMAMPGSENVNLPATITSMVDVSLTELSLQSDGLYYGVLRVNIWLEGWDLEAYNYQIAPQDITYLFTFE